MKTFLILACLATCAYAVDYCSISSCDWGSHIACNNNGALGSECLSGSVVEEITPALIKTFLEEHNKIRNTVAGGQLSPFKPASRMATMEWDTELAKMATLNVKRCIFKHDECRNTEQFSNSGQNLYMFLMGAPITGDRTALIKAGINKWYAENKATTMEDIDYCPDDVSKIGHFTVMVADRNVKLGCGCISMPPSPQKPGSYRYIIACNYATTNFISQSIYESSEEPATGCTNRNPLYPNLCAVGEVY